MAHRHKNKKKGRHHGHPNNPPGIPQKGRVVQSMTKSEMVLPVILPEPGTEAAASPAGDSPVPSE